MPADAQRFRFVAGTNARGESTLRPQIPLTLIHRSRSTAVTGLLDSGADVNVMPYSVGLVGKTRRSGLYSTGR